MSLGKAPREHVIAKLFGKLGAFPTYITVKKMRNDCKGHLQMFVHVCGCVRVLECIALSVLESGRVVS